MTILATLYVNNRLQNFYFKNYISEELCYAIASFTGSYPERYAKLFNVTEHANGKAQLVIRSVKDERLEVVNGTEHVDAPLAIHDTLRISILDKKLDKQFQLEFSTVETISTPMNLYKINKTAISIGRDESKTIRSNRHALMSRNHADIQLNNGDATITDSSSVAGVYVNQQRINGSAKLQYGDTIQILTLRIVYLGDYLAVNTKNDLSVKLAEVKTLDKRVPKVEQKIDKQFSPSARVLEHLIEEEVPIDLPPPPSENKEMPLLYTIGPSATMAFAMLGTLIYNYSSGKANPSSFFMAGSLLLGAFLWPLLSRSYQKKQKIKAEQLRVTKYRQYLQAEKEKLNQKLAINHSILNNHLYPNPERIMSYADEGNRKDFWSKNATHQDFLQVRLGTGQRPSTVRLHSSRQGFTLQDDPMLDELNAMLDQYKMMTNAPLTFSLQHNQLVGLNGSRAQNFEFLNTTLLNIVGLHHYEEVKVVLIFGEQDEAHLQWAFGMPHLWNDEKSMRFTASNKREFNALFTYLTEVFIQREEQMSESSFNKVAHSPRYVFVVTDPNLIDHEPFAKNLYNANNQLSITTIVATQNVEDLPKDCDLLIQSGDNVYDMYINDTSERNELLTVQKEPISLEQLQQYSETVLKINVKKEAAALEIPKSVGFLEMYSAGQFDSLGIENLWRASKPYESLRVPIGYGAGGTLFNLDIHEKFHGPHGLVAGTTGAGKSEFLQSYIISAAINYHPHDLAFVLIDYKGGGMANIFDNLPHLAGKITNLSGNMLQRSLNSIEAELKKRQRYFSEYEVNHIDKYQELYKEGVAKEPLPHLVLIADEFAQLKSQQSEFMAKLIDIAQIGRSLGVHLILATQKPAGLVDDQIWGNTRFRVCLKVADKRDSNEMIRKPDAAFIKLPGRCYVQVGYDEIYEQVQSAYSGQTYEPLETFIDPNEITVQLTDKTASVLKEEMKDIPKLAPILSNGKPVSQLDGLIQYIANIQQKRNIDAYKLWLPPLASKIYVHELEGFVQFINGWSKQEGLNTVFAMGDYTNTQQQKPLSIDFIHQGHTRIHGASTSGKTTALQTILYSFMSKYAPNDLQLYVFDLISEASRYYNAFPHCQDVITATDPRDVYDALETIEEVIEIRKSKFAKVYATTLEEYKEKTNEDLPNIIVAIDGMEQLRSVQELTGTVGRIAALLNISRAYGAYFIVTTTINDSMHYTIRDSIANVFSLQQNDKQHYRDVLGKTITIMPDNEKGRGLHIYEDELWEMQVALIAEDQTVPTLTKMQDLTGIAAQMTEQATKDGFISKKAPTVTKKKEKPAVAQAITAAKATTVMPQSGKPTTLRQREVEEGFAIGNRYKKAELQLVEINELKKFSILGSRTEEMKQHLQFLIDQISENQFELLLVDSLQTFKQLANESYYYRADEENLHEFVEVLTQMIASAELEKSLDSTPEPCFVVVNGFVKLYEDISDADMDILEKIAFEAQQVNIHFITLETDLNTLAAYSSTAYYSASFNNASGLYYESILAGQGYYLAETAAVDQKYTCLAGEVYAFIGQAYGLIHNPYREGA